MTKTRFDTRQTAHIWAQGNQEFGKNSNGQFYFEKEILYSYGRHFVVGVKLPDVTFINSDKHSLTTTKHQTYAANASFGFVSHVPDLTDIATQLVEISNSPKLPRDDWNRIRIKHYLEKHGFALGTNALSILMKFAGMPNSVKQVNSYHAKLIKIMDSKIAAREKAENKRAYDSAIKYVKTEFESDLLSAKSYDAKGYSRYNFIHEHDFIAPYIKRMRAHLKSLGEKQIKLTNKLRAGIKELTALHKAAKSKWLKSVELFDFSENKRAFKQQYKRDIFYINLWIVSAQKLMQFEKVKSRPELLSKIQAAIDAAIFTRQECQIELDRERFIAEEKRRVAWLAGESSYFNGTDLRGGALLRVKGDTLETSQGAKVPLDDAIKVFKMIKLVKERGKGWTRNGTTLPVGYFQVDAIKPNGDFKAGCHTINWPEVERIARELNLFELPSEDTTKH